MSEKQHARHPQGSFTAFVKECAKTMLHPKTTITKEGKDWKVRSS